MGFIGLLGATLILALAIAGRWFPAGTEEDLGERCAVVFLLWFAILVGLDWALAGLHLLTAPALYVAAAACALTGGTALVRRRRRSPGGGSARLEARLRGLDPVMKTALALCFLSTLYLVARSVILGGWVVEFDALSYHFPKAVEIVRARTIPHILCGDFRLPYFPWNYELLLADGLLLTPGDSFSSLIPLLAYGGFAASVYAVFRRAWPRAAVPDLVLGVLLALATPVLLLHITANKNDLLSAFFQMEFLLWSTLWYLKSGKRELGLALLSLALFLGTKATALFLGPFLVFMLWRRRSLFHPRAWGGGWKTLGAGAAAILILLALGAGWPLLNLAWTGKVFGDVAQAGGIDSFEAFATPHYNGISNLWRFPLLALMKPFSSNPMAVWVPWARQYWFWPSYRTVYGHFGWLCTVLLVLLPVGIRGHRRDPGAAPFRLLATIGILSFAAFALPQQYRVDGMFCGSPRYLLCLPVLVLLWTAVPLLSWLRQRQRFIHGLLGFAALAYFAGQSWVYFQRDETRSFAVVMNAMENPAWSMQGGVAEKFDRNAGANDPVALDGGFGALFYPIYGIQQQRPVFFLRPSPGTVAIPAQVKWVVIDRSWNAGWSHPGVTTTADFFLPIQGRVTAEDTAVFLQLSKDSAWRLVFLNPARAEAIFLRNAMAAP